MGLQPTPTTIAQHENTINGILGDLVCIYNDFFKKTISLKPVIIQEPLEFKKN